MGKKPLTELIKNPKHYCVTWVDAESWAYWHTEAEVIDTINSETYWIDMSGWILFEDERFLVLSTKRQRDGLWGNVYKIPKAWVIKKKRVNL